MLTIVNQSKTYITVYGVKMFAAFHTGEGRINSNTPDSRLFHIAYISLPIQNKKVVISKVIVLKW